MTEFNLTKTQEQFWILNNIFKGNSTYNIPSIFKLNGIPDLNTLNNAIVVLANRHQLLRANVTVNNGQPKIKINPEIQEYSIREVELQAAVLNSDIPSEVISEVHKQFDLSTDNLFRITLFKAKNGVSFLTFVFHHIIVDLRSKEIFASDLSEIYNSLKEGKEAVFVENPMDYGEYANWYNNWLNSEDAAKMAKNWASEMAEKPEPLKLPYDFEKPKNLTIDGARYNFEIDKNFSLRIKEFAKNNLVSPYVVLLTAYSIMLQRLSSQNEFNIGLPLSNRRKEEIKDIFGCFMNILPVNIATNDASTSASLIKDIRRKMMFLHRNQEIPFLNLIEILKEKNTSASNQLFETGFTFEPLMELNLNDIETTPVRIERKGAQLELFLILYEKGGIFNGTFEYSTELFARQTIKRWKEILISILNSMIENPELPISKLDILPEEEKNILTELNNTDTEYEALECLHQKFEKQVEKTPDFTALTFYDKKLTYNELNIQANRLAHFLIDSGTVVEDKIGICVNRSLEMYIAILATLKAGGAYVPFDTGAPAERLSTVNNDAGLKYIITTKESGANLNGFTNLIYVDDILNNPISEKINNPETGVQSGNLAYVMYTSGSTGKPKGVMIEHHSVMNKIGWIQKAYPVNQGEGLIQKTHVTFDVSVWELFWWFFDGGKLDILKHGGEKDPEAVVLRIKSTSPKLLIFVPSVFSLFIEYLNTSNQQDCLLGIKWIVFIGEALPTTLVNKYNSMYKGKNAPELINTYGPTEATVAVSWYECPFGEDLNKMYIGKPIDNTKLLIINDKNCIQPIGVPGELIITGVNLARGYLNAPELTSQKFIEIKLPDGSVTRAYKTGDLAKWDVSGEIDFIGRVDNQVKIRGMRVELGDIESKLLEYPDVKEAAVIFTNVDTGHKLLLAYVVNNDGQKGKANEIKEFLQKKLPSHMIPAHIVELEKMPLTTSGKINRKLLPKPELSSTNDYIPPSSQIEAQLVDIWKELLNIDKISVKDNFYDIGGDSMLAVTLASKIEEKLNTRIEVLKILEYPNIKAFAEHLSETGKKDSGISGLAEQRAAMRKKSARNAMARQRRF